MYFEILTNHCGSRDKGDTSQMPVSSIINCAFHVEYPFVKSAAGSRVSIRLAFSWKNPRVLGEGFPSPGNVYIRSKTVGFNDTICSTLVIFVKHVCICGLLILAMYFFKFLS